MTTIKSSLISGRLFLVHGIFAHGIFWLLAQTLTDPKKELSMMNVFSVERKLIPALMLLLFSSLVLGHNTPPAN